MNDMTVTNSPGVLTRTYDFGQTTSFETVDSTGLVKYIKPLADYLETLGYRRGKDIRGAPYDFRYSPGMRSALYDSSSKRSSVTPKFVHLQNFAT